LGAAHQLGIVHRDIKPDNVLLVPQPDGSDLAKVLDFGIAKVTGESLEAGPGYKPTSTGMVLGTPHYLSPEQARGKKSGEIDGRADLYALGVMLYEMVTGELPFKSDTAIEMLLHHIQDAPVPTHLLKPEMNIPAEASALIMKALEKDPAKRFQTGEEMAQALSIPLAAPIAGPERTPAGGSIAAFNTAAMAAASGTAPAVVPTRAATPPATSAIAPATGATEMETRALGSVSATMQTPAAPVATVAAMPKPLPAAANPSAKKKKRWLLWSAAGAIAVVLLLWIGWALANRNPQPAEEIPAYAAPVESERQPRRSEPRRTTRQEPAYETSQRRSAPAVSNDATQRARAQQLVAQGNLLLARRDFSGAQAAFQQALELDPNNSAAQHGLQVAQAGAVAQGLGSIFRH
jgi:serine/threonine-protein kinase